MQSKTDNKLTAVSVNFELKNLVLKKGLDTVTVFRYNFLESLILAQDERWRRA